MAKVDYGVSEDSPASASVLVNGSPSGEFQLQRGLRQGDPLSPLIFLLAAEGLSLLMKKASNGGFFKPAEIGREKIRVFHLQFADDTIFLEAANSENVRVIKRILKNMELISRLKVNYEKCWLYGRMLMINNLMRWPIFWIAIQAVCLLLL